MPRIFISYRRADSQATTDRIYDSLTRAFGEANVFQDVESIPLGTDFIDYLENQLDTCDVMLVMIGPDWASITDSNGNRRLDDPEDFVRLEVEAALGRRADMLVIPVLINHAMMPKSSDLPLSMRKLIFRNGISIRHNPYYNRDIEELIKSLKASLKYNEVEPDETPLSPPKPRSTPYKRALMVATAAVGLIIGVLALRQNAFTTSGNITSGNIADTASLAASAAETTADTNFLMFSSTISLTPRPTATLSPTIDSAAATAIESTIRVIMSEAITQTAIYQTSIASEPTATFDLHATASARLYATATRQAISLPFSNSGMSLLTSGNHSAALWVGASDLSGNITTFPGSLPSLQSLNLSSASSARLEREINQLRNGALILLVFLVIFAGSGYVLWRHRRSQQFPLRGMISLWAYSLESGEGQVLESIKLDLFNRNEIALDSRNLPEPFQRISLSTLRNAYNSEHRIIHLKSVEIADTEVEMMPLDMLPGDELTVYEDSEAQLRYTIRQDKGFDLDEEA